MTQPESTTNVKSLARWTGVLYLIIIVTAGFSEGVVRSSVIVPGDAAATAANILANEGLYRFGFVTDLIAFMCDLAVSILLYVLLKPVNKTLALVAASFRLVAHPALASLNLLNHMLPLLLLSGNSYLTAFSPDQLNALSLLFLNLHGHGYYIAGAFFGVHLVLLGYLMRRSDLFPSLLGVLLALAGVGYLVESFGMFLFPAHETVYAWIVGVTAVLGEVILAFWLVIKGVRTRSL